MRFIDGSLSLLKPLGIVSIGYVFGAIGIKNFDYPAVVVLTGIISGLCFYFGVRRAFEDGMIEGRKKGCAADANSIRPQLAGRERRND